jgi:hypothetical protein
MANCRAPRRRRRRAYLDEGRDLPGDSQEGIYISPRPRGEERCGALIMDDDIKKAAVTVSIVAAMFLIGEHAYNQEKSLYSKLMRMWRG